MTTPMDKEWEAWQNVVHELRSLGIEVNDETHRSLVEVLKVWGERLALLRREQPKDLSYQVLAEIIERS